MKTITIIPAASGSGASDQGCVDGPGVLQNSQYWLQLKTAGLTTDWLSPIKPDLNLQNCDLVAQWADEIAQHSYSLTNQGKNFAVVGGDHACAIGTWSGVYQATHKQGPLGMIWIDAHLDSHTHDTSETQAIHGMPVAALLGYGDKRLTDLAMQAPKLKPENLVIIGVRSYECGEHDLINRLNIKVYYQDEVDKRGFESVFQEALTSIRNKTPYYGVSLDLDAIDPIQAPGVGSPEAKGIDAQQLKSAFTTVAQDDKFIGFELAEFNPHHDVDKKTEKLSCELIAAITLGKDISL